MEIIQEQEFGTSVSFSHEYVWADCPGAGFGFDCDESGKPSFEGSSSAARENYAMCLKGEGKDGTKIIDKGIICREHRYRIPAVGKCECGALVTLDGFTNTCDRCELDYNSSGQQLAPRSQWGEETGETAADILRVH